MFKKRISIYVIVRFDLIRILSEIGKKEGAGGGEPYETKKIPNEIHKYK